MQTKQFSTKLHDTLAYTDGKNKMIWFRPSVGEICPCTSVQHGTTETVSTYLTLNLLAPTKVGARINPYPANVEKMVSS